MNPSSVSVNLYQTTWRVFLNSKRSKNKPRLCVFPYYVTHNNFQFHGKLTKDNDNVTIDLYMVRGAEGVHRFDYRISFPHWKSEKIRLVIGGCGLFQVGTEIFNMAQRHTVPVSYLMEHCYTNDSVYIHFEVDVPIVPPKTYAIEQSAFKSSKLFDDMHELLKNGEMSDVTLVLGGKEFAAHKAILSARSSVFKRMFQHNFKEKLENKVTIPDIDGEVGQEFLSFLYTEEAPNLDQFAVELLVASDRYELESLKQACEANLSGKLAIDSVAQVLVLADMHRAPQLKEKCIDYMTDHSRQVIATEGWKVLHTRPELFSLLFEKLSLKK